MSFDRPLRGGCLCGRNRYIITLPQNTTQLPRVIFDNHGSYHASHGGSPLSAYLRVPLQCYFSTTLPLFPDETTSMIYKLYPSNHGQRRFCGFCGTPLSYWREEPPSESHYIQLALGSLSPEDLADIEELGLLPELDEEKEPQPMAKDQDADMDDGGGGADAALVPRRGRETIGSLPWLDTLTAGSRLGMLCAAQGHGANRKRTIRVEWEVVEWTEDELPEAAKNGKRKRADRESGAEAGAMEGVQQ